MTMMETSTHSELTPVFSPRILGARMLPSICWMTRMHSRKMMTLTGSVSRMMTAVGTTPRKGPMMGMMSVTPTTVATSTA